MECVAYNESIDFGVAPLNFELERIMIRLFKTGTNLSGWHCMLRLNWGFAQNLRSSSKAIRGEEWKGKNVPPLRQPCQDNYTAEGREEIGMDATGLYLGVGIRRLLLQT